MIGATATSTTAIDPAEPFVAKRVSWGAVFAGITLALVTQLLLSLLGMAIGFSVVDASGDADPTDGFGIGAGIYFVLSSILSLFVGGYVAGSLATVQTTRDRILHGLLTWGGASILLFLLLTTAIGNLIGGTASLLGKGLAGAGAAAAAVAPAVADVAGESVDDMGLDLSSLREEVRTLLRQTGKPELQPEALGETADDALDTTGAAARQVATAPTQSGEQIDSLFDRLEAEGSEVWNAVDREAMVNLVQARTGNSRAEATKVVSEYEETYQQARAEWEALKVETEQKARAMADKAADGVAKAAFWTFLMLLAGAIAAEFGANVGARGGMVVRRHGS